MSSKNPASPYEVRAISSPLRRPFTLGSSARSRSSQISLVEQTSQLICETFGAPVPVLVYEAITGGERRTDVSVKLQESGWATLVCGRRLFVWRFKKESVLRSMAVNCKELRLPASDLAHKAELVHVEDSTEAQMPSVVAVSPEGIVRYWPNIAHEGTSYEIAADLQGQECFSLTSVYPLGCILATTTSSLVLITLSTHEGQHTIHCMTLKLPQGVLAGLGRRVSSFIFGAMPTQSSEGKQLNKVLSMTEEGDRQSLYVLSGNVFQKWNLGEDDPYQLSFEMDLDRYLKEGFLESLWNADSSHLHHLKTWCLDMQFCQGGVVVLTAGMNPLISQEMFYAFGVLEEPQASPSPVLSSFNVIKYSESYTEQDEERLLGYRFVFPPDSDEKAYMYAVHKIICASVFCDTEPDVIEFSNVENTILGAGASGALPLFFTRLHGLLSVQPYNANQEFETELGSYQESVKVCSTSDIPIVPTCPTLPEKVTTALYLYFEGNFDGCKVRADEIHEFLNNSDETCSFDSVVVHLSLKLIDDYPVSDPRWCESVPSGDATSSSLIIMHQLDDKLKTHDRFVSFLKYYDLWNKLSVVAVRDTKMSTWLVLLENAEKLVAAKILHKLFLERPALSDVVIQDALGRRAVEVKKPLGQWDVFFQEVSHIDSFLPSLLKWQENQLSSCDDDMKIIFDTVGTVNFIIVNVFQAVLNFRNLNKESYSYKNGISKAEYIPWTSAEGIQTLLLEQHSITAKYALYLPEEIDAEGEIYETFVDLVHVLLDGLKSQVESLEECPENRNFKLVKEKFSRERTRLIYPLVMSGQHDRAAMLAEKYYDFGLLIQLCENTKNMDRLQEYCVRFKDEGFSDFVFNWYVNKGQRGKFFEYPLCNLDNLKSLVQPHDDLSWLYQLRSGDYCNASALLKKLALEEHQYLSKKKTLLSLSKLSALVSDHPEDKKSSELEALNFHEDLVLYQEGLPAEVCEAFGLDADSARVLSPEEMIEMYICEENVSADQYSFKIALDLLNFIPKPAEDEYVQNLRLKIFARAIQRDTWEDLDTNNPIAAVESTMLYRIIELAFDEGSDIHSILPSMDYLLKNPELQSLAENPTFSFFLGALYERFERLSV